MKERKTSTNPCQAAPLNFACLMNRRRALYFQVMAKINLMGYSPSWDVSVLLELETSQSSCSS